MKHGLLAVVLFSVLVPSACPSGTSRSDRARPRCGAKFVPSRNQTPLRLDTATAVRILNEARVLSGVAVSFSTAALTCEPPASRYDEGRQRAEALEKLSTAGLMRLRASKQSEFDSQARCRPAIRTFEPIHDGECKFIGDMQHSHGKTYWCRLGTESLEEIIRIDPRPGFEAVVTAKVRFEPTSLYARWSEAIAARRIQVRPDIQRAMGSYGFWPAAEDMRASTGSRRFDFELCDTGWRLAQH